MSELTVGSLSGLAANSYVIDVASGSSLDLSNGATLPAGSIIQVVSTTKTDTFATTSSSYTDITGLSATITPTSSSSKILVFFSVDAVTTTGTTNSMGGIQLVRDATAIAFGDAAGNRSVATVGVSSRETSDNVRLEYSKNFLDEPSTTSSVTYKLQAEVQAGTLYVNSRQADADSSINYRSVSTITVMEVAG
jgi:hypothetical protein